MKSVTVTTHRALNYGAILQAYALQKVQIEMGIDNVILDDEPITNLYYSFRTKTLRGIFVRLAINAKIFIHKREIVSLKTKFEKFLCNYLKTTRSYATIEDLRKDPPEADFYINGSDQVLGIRDVQSSKRMLDFGDSKIKKFSYAASLAEYDWNEDEKKVVTDKLSNYEMISVREKYAKEYLEKFIGRQCDVHMDPVFMVDRKEFDNIAIKPDIDEPYILIYPLLSNEDLQPLINRMKAQTGYKTVCVMSTRTVRYKVDETIYTAGPEEFVGLIQNAAAVITTSFHGTAFSILYEKPFYTLIKNFKSQRITDLLNMLDLNDRLYNSGKEVNLTVDFTKANQVIANEKIRCRAYFRDVMRIVKGER